VTISGVTDTGKPCTQVCFCQRCENVKVIGSRVTAMPFGVAKFAILETREIVSEDYVAIFLKVDR
jgi:hypothetical protein